MGTGSGSGGGDSAKLGSRENPIILDLPNGLTVDELVKAVRDKFSTISDACKQMKSVSVLVPCKKVSKAPSPGT